MRGHLGKIRCKILKFYKIFICSFGEKTEVNVWTISLYGDAHTSNILKTTHRYVLKFVNDFI